MKVAAKIAAREDEVGRECFKEICRIYPSGRKFTVFNSAFVPDDPRTLEILKILQAYGKKLPTSVWGSRPDETRIEFIREYEESDFSQSSYLELRPEETIACQSERSPDGVLELSYDPYYFTGKFTLAAASSETVVSDEVRERMLNEDFRGIVFRQAHLIGEGAEELHDPIWELRSELTLPPVSNKLCDCYGGIDYHDPDKGLTIDEGLFLPVELHYNFSSIRAMEPFDIAMTREAWGFRLQYHKRVVSNRFYNFCQKNRFKIHWVPVRLDQG